MGGYAYIFADLSFGIVWRDAGALRQRDAGRQQKSEK
jgi:hypothetical protein